MTAPTLTLDSRVRVNDDVLFQELQGEAVLLNLKTGVYFGLDPVGTRIWQLFPASETAETSNGRLADVVQTIVSEYDVTEERCASDLLALVADLGKQELVTVS